MGLGRRTDVVALVLALVWLLALPALTWGQAGERIGTVLAVDGTAVVRAANAATWEPLQFRAAIFLNDTVQTRANSRVKVLLRDDSIMTLAENSEMHFTEFVLRPEQQQRRTVISLALGKLKVLTTGLFGPGSATEVRTPNTVAGVRGTTFIVIFIPPDITQVIGLDGVVTVRNLDPAIPQIEPIPPNFRTQVTGNRAPERATAIPLNERQSLEGELRLTEQVPSEVQPTSERQAAGPIRGEEEAAPGGPQVLGVTAAQLGVPPVGRDAEAQLELLTGRTAQTMRAQTAEPPAGP
ncbi:MAG: FecR family protein, partial [candidate division KSB1 bacterium]|nr:FecR family protein [candidate division KSB1 bacterium]